MRRTTGTKALHAVRVLASRQGSFLRTGDLLKAGIHPRTLYAMVRAGDLEKVSRGLYRPAGGPPLANPDLVTVALKAPRAVVCLLSALAVHGLTAEIPHEIDIALRRGDTRPRLDHPPLRVHWFTGAAYSEGIETKTMGGVPVRLYCREKTLADVFKYRNMLGIDTAVDALRRYWRSRQSAPEALLHFCRICRVERVIRPYMEGVL